MKVQLFNDNFQNFKKYGIPKAQLVIADIPYNIGTDAYDSISQLDGANSSLMAANKKLAADRKALINEQCQHCGKYKQAHEGACDGCRWREM